MITLAQLIACGIGPTQARAFIDPLGEVFHAYGIESPQRMAAFIAQAAHESSGFTRLEENLYYTTPERIRAVFPSSIPSAAEAARFVRNPKALANRVYAGKNGNSNEASGDGFRYRGRGLFQLTGLSNYSAAGVKYLANPDLVATPLGAALTAGGFWSASNMNALADTGSIDAITRKINGRAMLGAAERRAAFEANLKALT